MLKTKLNITEQFLSSKFTNAKLLIFSLLMSFLLYGNTLNHSYALDDAIVITKNEFTKQGFSGIKNILSTDSFTGFFGRQKKLVEGGRYRPLSLVSFAVEYELFGLNPFISHLFNILIYAIIAFLVFKLSYILLKYSSLKNYAYSGSFIASLLFIIHPLHTEVVANIKGRDELFSLLFTLFTLYLAYKYTKSSKKSLLPVMGITLFLACMSKENAISFVAITPVFILLTDSRKKNKALQVFGVLLISSIAFVAIRQNVLGSFSAIAQSELMNNPFAEATTTQKYATILFTWLVYFKLLVFPHPLTYDYYPYHVSLHNFGEPLIWLSIAMTASILFSLFKYRKNEFLLSFVIFGFIASFSLVSNLIFPVGTFMNERFLFMPSFFWSILLGYLIVKIMSLGNKFSVSLSLILVGYFICFFTVKTIARNRVWADDITLFMNDIETSKNSAKGNCIAGGQLWEIGKNTIDKLKQDEIYSRSEKYLLRSLEIYPNYVDALLLLGNLKFDDKNQISESADCYLKILNIQRGNSNALKNIDIVLQNSKNRQEQLKYYLKLFELLPNNYNTNYRIGVIYGRYLNDFNNSIKFLAKAVEIDNKNPKALKDLGTAYGITGNSEQAYKIFKQAIMVAPNDKQIFINMGIASQNLGRIKEAEQYFKKAKTLK